MSEPVAEDSYSAEGPFILSCQSNQTANQGGFFAFLAEG